jgi:hypothetical protein
VLASADRGERSFSAMIAAELRSPSLRDLCIRELSQAPQEPRPGVTDQNLAAGV